MQKSDGHIKRIGKRVDVGCDYPYGTIDTWPDLLVADLRYELLTHADSLQLTEAKVLIEQRHAH